MTGMDQGETALSWYKYSRSIFSESMHHMQDHMRVLHVVLQRDFPNFSLLRGSIKDLFRNLQR
eukprot:5602127-Pleurochrysis_carterae.AAC.1